MMRNCLLFEQHKEGKRFLRFVLKKQNSITAKAKVKEYNESLFSLVSQ